MKLCDSYYGSYRTRTFNEIFEGNYEVFQDKLEEISNDNMTTLLKNKVQLVYILLASRYGNSHIANSDENQFILQVYSKLFQFAPTWLKRLEIQESLRNLSIDELRQGSKAIYNSALNPDQPPSTGALEELTRIASQNTTNYKRSTLEAYAQLVDLLETDITEDFLRHFKKLFIQITAPDYPLLYKTEVD